MVKSMRRETGRRSKQADNLVTIPAPSQEGTFVTSLITYILQQVLIQVLLVVPSTTGRKAGLEVRLQFQGPLSQAKSGDGNLGRSGTHVPQPQVRSPVPSSGRDVHKAATGNIRQSTCASRHRQQQSTPPHPFAHLVTARLLTTGLDRLRAILFPAIQWCSTPPPTQTT